MAYPCTKGFGECTGCGWCEEQRERAVVGVCAHCGEEIYSGDEHYEFPDEVLVCDVCMISYCNDNFLRRGSVWEV